MAGSEKRRVGKLFAREKILALVDSGSFREIGKEIKSRIDAFGTEESVWRASGVITGYGTVGGRRVVIYAQDSSVMAGTLGKKQGEKIVHAIRLAIDNRCPLIGILDSGGARIQEGVDALAGYGEVFYYQTLASGYIPQISVIAGNCAGGAAYSPGLTDFVFMVKTTGSMFVTGPRVVETVLHQKVKADEFGGAKMHGKRSGVAQFSCEDEQDCYRQVRELLGMIPHFYGDVSRGCRSEAKDHTWEEAAAEKIERILPSRKTAVYQMQQVITCLVDQGKFLECGKEFAPSILTGFGKIEGICVGIVANQPYNMGGVLDVDSSVKAARFIRYCDCYDIPVITLVDVPGFMPGESQEERGIIRHGAKLLYAYAESTVPKITVILRRAYGGAYIAMGSRHLGSDFVYAWPDAEIAVMGEEAAVEILCGKKLKLLDEKASREQLRKLTGQYRSQVMNTRTALAQGYVDAILSPSQTRDRICSDLRMLQDKYRRPVVTKKHGNIPL